MTQGLVRFGIAMEPRLLAQLDQLAEERGCTRSELLRDLARTEVVRSAVHKRVQAVASVTLVYNHHVRELSEKLTAIQHELGGRVRSAMHVHLDHDNCLEVIVMRGPSDQLKAAAERMVSTRGVIHGGIELVPESNVAMSSNHRHGRGAAHDHAHPHPHPHEHDPVPPKKKSKKSR
jgi:CopG family nickel-responsive transcriptional regulator